MSAIRSTQMIKPFRCVNAPKNKFSAAEDEMLRNLVRKYGENEWDLISQVLGTKNSRQCHDRWVYNLSPKVNKKPFTEEEDQKLLDLVENLGPHWVQISKRMPGRTDTQIKNRYKVLKRRVNSIIKNIKFDLFPRYIMYFQFLDSFKLNIIMPKF
ncbi:Myb-like DNA-binding domain containing protein [Trichomonas vaginalis G3]|uniref:Myb-like DNA-binding domain containing protein n=1 Tax=Trichomonas vaginalis (strain ATCC PRA-98 / G3) TaxID=412133 RepID=A2FLC0_TRIV3|nr:RNA polymerase II transcription regulator recruiting protein [Trichomonas vaginalis G3]EAX94301.1 Myb-like DNA-binding domain containing protein [Trichomonas vaginalis G3]KAI5510347.1 RNA polymerase II transcription regulator recruiting protein [Trichomonas vaginalis G3]|eukprot:XP_001307231.1 Myb-like DNA-binding domain containing protein [Trichomonas vaginalis G3]